MTNGLLQLAFTLVYFAKNTMNFANPKFFALLRKKIDRTQSDFLRGVELSVAAQQRAEVDQRICLFNHFTEFF